LSSSLHAPPPPPISTTARLAARVFCAFLAASVLFSVSLTRNWGITQDTPLIHYVVFLMAHGFAPYRDIVEMNMPGSYMTEWAVMHILGPGDLAWRCFDLILMAVAAIAAWRILRPAGKFPAFVAAATITLYHLGGGRSDVGQRDYTMAVLLLLGCAFLLDALRRTRPWLFAPFAACVGWAAAIKPTVVPFAFLVLVVAVLSLRMRRLRLAPYLLWAFLGALVPTLLVAGFLSHYHAWPAFLDLLRNLAPYHRGNGNLPLRQLILRWLPWTYYPLALALLVLAFLMRSVRVLDNALLAAFFLFGVACYIYQGKGWNYHASTAMLFLIVLAAALSAASSRSVIAAALLAFAVFLPAAYTPIQIWRHGRVPDFAYQASLGNNLNALESPSSSGPALSGKIQCLDWNAGCIDVLYRQHIVQSTGFIYDFYLFPAHPAPVTAALQARFLAAMQSNPPRVIVLTNHDWPAMQGFAKLDRWPAFELWLNQHYTLATEQWPTARAYRIYLLNK
jgi:hypothetical protein